MMRTGVRILALMLGLSGSGLSSSFAQADPFPLEPYTREGSERAPFVTYADVVAPARRAVASVTSLKVIREEGSDADELGGYFRRFYGGPEDREDEDSGRRVENGVGSGVIISADGYVLTNNHVVSDQGGDPADEVEVVLPDGSEYRAEIVGRDPRTDLALLKIDAEDLPFVGMADSDGLQVGDLVFAIGNPLGLGQTTTMGVVSAIGRTELGLLGAQGYENFIQTDASINRGNSGGALVDSQGRLVGINTAIVSGTGGNIGIGFAIPITMARGIALKLLAEGEVRRGYLGVSLRELSRHWRERLQTSLENGVVIRSIQEGSPAETAGLLRDDIITRIGSQDVSTISELRLAVADMEPGSEVMIEFWREGKTDSVAVVLADLDAPEEEEEAAADPLPGLSLQPLDDQIRGELGLEDGEEGLLITSVDRESPYFGRLEEDEVILEVNDTAATDVEALAGAIKPGRVNKFLMIREGRRRFLSLMIEPE